GGGVGQVGGGGKGGGGGGVGGFPVGVGDLPADPRGSDRSLSPPGRIAGGVVDRRRSHPRRSRLRPRRGAPGARGEIASLPYAPEAQHGSTIAVLGELLAGQGRARRRDPLRTRVGRAGNPRPPTAATRAERLPTDQRGEPREHARTQARADRDSG